MDSPQHQVKKHLENIFVNNAVIFLMQCSFVTSLCMPDNFTHQDGIPVLNAIIDDLCYIMLIKPLWSTLQGHCKVFLLERFC